MLDAAPERSTVNRAAWNVITAKTRIRTLEAGMASLEARSKMAESALNGMLTAETPAYRRANVEQNLAMLREQRKELRSSLDEWQVRLKVALRDVAGIEVPSISASNEVTPVAKESQVRRPRSKKTKGSAFGNDQSLHRLRPTGQNG